MVKRSHFACRHNGSHAASAQYKVIRLLSASREIRHATTIQAATKLDFRVQSTQACWQLPSRRHHVSNPRLIKNTDGNLFRHLKSVQHSRLYRIDGAQRKFRPMMCENNFTKPKVLRTHPTHVSTTLSDKAEPSSQVNSITRASP